MVRTDRILMWGIEEQTDSLLEQGLNNHAAIAQRLNSMESVVQATGDNKVLGKDVENYVRYRNRKIEERKTKALAYSPEGRDLVERTRENVGWLVEQVELMRPIMPRVMNLYNKALERAETAMEDPDNIDIFPTQILTGLEKQLRLMKDIVAQVKDDDKIQQLVRAENLTVNQNRGMSYDEFLSKLNGTVMALTCPHCNFKGFTESDAMSAYAARQRQGVVDGKFD